MAKTQIQKFAIIAFTSIVLLAGIYNNKADAAVTCYTNCYGNMCTTTCY